MKHKDNELIFSFHQNIFNKFLGYLLALGMITLTLCLFHNRELLFIYILSMAVTAGMRQHFRLSLLSVDFW